MMSSTSVKLCEDHSILKVQEESICLCDRHCLSRELNNPLCWCMVQLMSAVSDTVWAASLTVHYADAWCSWWVLWVLALGSSVTTVNTHRTCSAHVALTISSRCCETKLLKTALMWTEWRAGHWCLPMQWCSAQACTKQLAVPPKAKLHLATAISYPLVTTP